MFEKVNTQNPGAGEEKQRRACPAPPAPGMEERPRRPNRGRARTRADGISARAETRKGDLPRWEPADARRPGRPYRKRDPRRSKRRGRTGAATHHQIRRLQQAAGASRSPPPAEPRGAEARRGAPAQSDGRAPAQAQAPGQFIYRCKAGGLGAVAEQGRALGGRLSGRRREASPARAHTF